jgi:hypothetical protein
MRDLRVQRVLRRALLLDEHATLLRTRILLDLHRHVFDDVLEVNHAVDVRDDRTRVRIPFAGLTALLDVRRRDLFAVLHEHRGTERNREGFHFDTARIDDADDAVAGQRGDAAVRVGRRRAASRPRTSRSPPS